MTAPAVLPFPNSIPVVIAYLAAKLAEITGGPITVAGDVPAGEELRGLLPWIRVEPVSMVEAIPEQVDRVTVAVDVYGARLDLGGVDALTLLVRACLSAMKGQTYPATGGQSLAVTDVANVSVQSRLPDDDPTILRAQIFATLLVRRLPTT